MYEGIDEYCFHGSHAARTKQLKEFLGAVFRYADVLALAPIVGFSNNRRAERDSNNNDEARVPLGPLQSVNGQLELAYKTIMLLDQEYEPDEEERFKKAFQTAPEYRTQDDLDYFESYVRGGVDFLYDKIIGEGNTDMDRLIELQDFVDSYASRHQ